MKTCLLIAFALVFAVMLALTVRDIFAVVSVAVNAASR